MCADEGHGPHAGVWCGRASAIQDGSPGTPPQRRRKKALLAPAQGAGTRIKLKVSGADIGCRANVLISGEAITPEQSQVGASDSGGRHHTGLFLSFALEERRYAIRLDLVERVLATVELIEVPRAPEIVPGLVDLHGHVIPAVDARRRFSLPTRPMQLDDRLIVARAGDRTVALLVDEVLDILEIATADVRPANGIVPGLDYLEGVLAAEDGTILIHDLGACLSLEEGAQLDRALAAASESVESTE